MLRRNDEILPSARAKENLKVNHTPEVPNDALMSAIVSRYKGKAVVMDFWATCGPCLEAIVQSRDFKKQLSGKDVAFVYVSGPSSPKTQWEYHIQGIGENNTT